MKKTATLYTLIHHYACMVLMSARLFLIFISKSSHISRESKNDRFILLFEKSRTMQLYPLVHEKQKRPIPPSQKTLVCDADWVGYDTLLNRLAEAITQIRCLNKLPTCRSFINLIQTSKVCKTNPKTMLKYPKRQQYLIPYSGLIVLNL